MTPDVIKMMTDLIGMVGVVLVLIGYLCLNTSKMSAVDIRYQLMNFIGSWLILVSLLYSWNLASVIIEIAWIMISVIGIYRCYRIYQQRKNRHLHFEDKTKD